MKYKVLIRENIIELKETNPNLPAREKMKRIGEMCREIKQMEKNNHIKEEPDWLIQ